MTLLFPWGNNSRGRDALFANVAASAFKPVAAYLKIAPAGNQNAGILGRLLPYRYFSGIDCLYSIFSERLFL
jgi:hypothetical protein